MTDLTLGFIGIVILMLVLFAVFTDETLKILILISLVLVAPLGSIYIFMYIGMSVSESIFIGSVLDAMWIIVCASWANSQ